STYLHISPTSNHLLSLHYALPTFNNPTNSPLPSMRHLDEPLRAPTPAATRFREKHIPAGIPSTPAHPRGPAFPAGPSPDVHAGRSEEHTSELQSLTNIV